MCYDNLHVHLRRTYFAQMYGRKQEHPALGKEIYGDSKI